MTDAECAEVLRAHLMDLRAAGRSALLLLAPAIERAIEVLDPPYPEEGTPLAAAMDRLQEAKRKAQRTWNYR